MRPQQQLQLLFSPQLWKAVGLVPQQLRIRRDAFFDVDLLEAQARAGQRCEHEGEDFAASPSQRSRAFPQPKRRRGPVEDDDCSEAARAPSREELFYWDAAERPSLEAISKAPRRARARATRRAVASTDALVRAVDAFRWPLEQPEEELLQPAAERRTSASGSGLSQEPVAVPSTTLPSPCILQTPHVAPCPAKQLPHAAKVQPLSSGDKADAPASHSAESSQGVFGGSVSPSHGGESGVSKSWGVVTSPSAADDDIDC
jgi:hypothetical protein